MNDNHYSLILASKSPRRKELLGYSKLPYVVMSSGIDEKTDESEPHRIVTDLARQKGEAVFAINQKERQSEFAKTFFPFVVAADTLVFLDGKQLGTPHNRVAAEEMLRELSGRTHQVFTGVFWKYFDFHHTKSLKTHSFYLKSDVTFAPIDEDILQNYLLTDDPLDKAGAYGIQGPALTFIRHLDGSYSNVVGFPLFEFLAELKKDLGYKNGNGNGSESWRKLFR